MSASFTEAQTGPGDQILDGSRYQPLARPGECRDRGGDGNGDALHVVAGDLDLTGVEATADFNVESTDRLDNGAGTTHGTCRAVERGEEPVPKRSHFVSPEAREFPPHRRVRRFDQVGPALAAQRLRPCGGPHHAGEPYASRDS